MSRLNPGAGPSPRESGEDGVMPPAAVHRVRLILAAILLVALGVAAYLVMYNIYPLYTAEAYIECISPEPKKPEIQQPVIQEDLFLRFVNSQALYIKSYPVLSLALMDPVLAETSWYKRVDQDDRMAALEAALSVEPVRDSNYIRVAMAARDPDDPHRIVNTITSKYLAQVRDTYVGPFRDELNEYRREYDQVRKQIESKNDQIRAFIAALDPGNIPEDRNKLGTGVVREQLLQNYKLVVDLEQQTAELESLKIQYASPDTTAVAPEDKAAVEQDPRVMQLDSTVLGMERDLAVLLAKKGPNDPEYTDMLARKKQAEEQLYEIRKEVLRERTELRTEQIETAYYNSRNALLKAQGRLLETQGKQSDLECKQSQYLQMLDERDLLVEIQNRIDEYVRELDRVVREGSAIRVTTAVSAQPPTQRSFPKPYMLPLAAVTLPVAAVVLLLLWIPSRGFWRWLERATR